MWDLWWTKWHWEEISDYFALPVSISAPYSNFTALPLTRYSLGSCSYIKHSSLFLPPPLPMDTGRASGCRWPVRPGFYPRPVGVRIVKDKVTLGHESLGLLRFFPVSIILRKLHACTSFIYHRHSIILAVDSIVK
jgi:hypothetical protein